MIDIWLIYSIYTVSGLWSRHMVYRWCMISIDDFWSTYYIDVTDVMDVVDMMVYMLWFICYLYIIVHQYFLWMLCYMVYSIHYMVYVNISCECHITWCVVQRKWLPVCPAWRENSMWFKENSWYQWDESLDSDAIME